MSLRQSPEFVHAVRTLSAQCLLPVRPAPAGRAVGLTPDLGVDTVDKFRGALVGSAMAAASVGRGDLLPLGEPPLVPNLDDPPLAFTVARQLAATGRPFDPKDFSAAIARGAGAGHAPRNATRATAEQLRRGLPWWEAGARSTGVGAAARGAPLALRHASDLDAMLLDVALATIVTHRQTAAVLGAAAQACAVAWCAHRLPGTVIPQRLVETVAMALSAFDEPDPQAAEGYPGKARLLAGLSDMLLLLPLSPEEAFARLSHRPGCASDALPKAWWCFLRAPNDVEEATALAAAAGPFAHSIAALTGALGGAHVGLSGLSPAWRAAAAGVHPWVEVSDELHRLSRVARQHRPPRRPAAPPVDAPREAGILADYVRCLRIGEPARLGSLWLYPISGGVRPAPDYLTGPDAAQRELLRVGEQGAGVVARLLVDNLGDVAILLAEGEMLCGARQNRTVNVSTLLPPRSRVVVPVSCVERGRWGVAREVEHSAYHASASVRAHKIRSVAESVSLRGDKASDQGAVWREIDRTHERHRVRSSTGALEDLFRPGQLQIDEAALTALRPGPSQLGVIVATGGRVLGADIFDRPSTLAVYWDRLVRAYSADAAIGDVAMLPGAAAAFLQTLGAASGVRADAVGLGRELHVNDAVVASSALVWDDVPVHVAAFTM